MSRPALVKSSSTVDLSDLITYHGTSITTGLTTSQLESKHAEYGYNELDKEDPTRSGN